MHEKEAKMLEQIVREKKKKEADQEKRKTDA
jgi:hypothetical protein